MRRTAEIDHYYGWPAWPASFKGRHARWISPLALAVISYVAAMALPSIITQGPPETTGDVLLHFVVSLALLIMSLVFIIRTIRGAYSSWRSYRRSSGHLNRREKAIAAQRDEMAASWSHAQQVRAQLISGTFSGARLPWELPPQSGEQLVAEGNCAYARYYGQDVSWVQNSSWFFGRASFVIAATAVSALGSSSRRRAAEREAATQWREHQNAHLVVTTHRLAVKRADGVWLSFWYGGISAIYPGIAEWTVVLDFPDTEPLMLSGLPAPSAAVTAVAALYDADGLLKHPGLAPLNT